MKRKWMKRKLLAVCTALLLCVGVLSPAALAEGEINSLATLQAAIDAADSGDIITLTGDVIFTDGVLTVSQSVTLDLNGKTLSGSEPSNINKTIIVTGGATLTIDDTSTDKLGKIVSTDAGTQPRVISVEDGGLILKNGTISTEGTTSAAQGIYLGSSATFVMDGGKVMTNANATGYCMGINLKGSGSSFSLNDGEVVCNNGNAVSTSGGTTFAMSGGSIDGQGSVRAAVSGSMGNTQIEITGGAITADIALQPGQNNTTQVSGDPVITGEVKATNSTLEISGGEFNGAISGHAEKTKITGGSFSEDPSQYAVGNTIVAGITSGGDTYYLTGDETAIAAAAQNAVAGDEIDIKKGSLSLDLSENGIIIKNSGEGNVTVNDIPVAQGEELSHVVCDPEEAWQADATSHWHNCSECGEPVADTLAAHTFGQWQTVKAAAVGVPGSEKQTCTICAYAHSREIAALNPPVQEGEKTDPGASPIPNTGDQNLPALWTVLMLCAASAMAVTAKRMRNSR